MVTMLLLLTHGLVFGEMHVFHELKCIGLLKQREPNTTLKNPSWRNYSFE
jgi:hypothetical protein